MLTNVIGKRGQVLNLASPLLRFLGPGCCCAFFSVVETPRAAALHARRVVGRFSVVLRCSRAGESPECSRVCVRARGPEE